MAKRQAMSRPRGGVRQTKCRGGVGRNDAQGLYVNLRIGPFIEAEWRYGGFPFWLHDVPDITFRSDNEPFKQHMQRFVTDIVNMMKHERLYYPQGGPIIISQIENEYQMVEPAFGSSGQRYVSSAAAMAVNLQTGVPWTMCKQNDAPDPVVGLIWQPTWGHLRELHTAVKQSSEPLLFGTYSNFSLGQEQEVNAQHGTRTTEQVQSFNDINTWKAYKESIPQDVTKAMYTGNQLFEHLTTTKDETDYLWYIVGLLAIQQTELSSTNLKDSGAHMERRVFGIRKVSIQQGWEPEHLLNNELWGYQVGLFGERNSIYAQEGSNNVEWTAINNLTYSSLTWYKTTFPTPAGNDAVILNLTGMGKGEVWINGESIGRYWVSFKAPSGNPSQSLQVELAQILILTSVATVPSSPDNLTSCTLEMGGDPQQITVNTVSITRVCGNVNELSTPSLQSQDKEPAVDISCQEGKQISAIEFASYGNPVGDCTSYGIGNCHAGSSEWVVKQACVGKTGCSIPITPAKFGGDPCPGIQKSLLVVASCR
ncbi:beta-galactosidase 7-like [Panicum miliaceum]|uniref:beta-galactosidase n=1 Tax=Panicum miliaceum TaxID=4540 RepID=A0A3L6T3C6_PANMI|nr:beta-galactosidase 7-like [Panicum miliaceum]